MFEPSRLRCARTGQELPLPALARLRLVQAAGPGSRLVLQVGNGPVPVVVD